MGHACRSLADAGGIPGTVSPNVPGADSRTWPHVWRGGT